MKRTCFIISIIVSFCTIYSCKSMPDDFPKNTMRSEQVVFDLSMYDYLSLFGNDSGAFVETVKPENLYKSKTVIIKTNMVGNRHFLRKPKVNLINICFSNSPNFDCGKLSSLFVSSSNESGDNEYLHFVYNETLSKNTSEIYSCQYKCKRQSEKSNLDTIFIACSESDFDFTRCIAILIDTTLWINFFDFSFGISFEKQKEIERKFIKENYGVVSSKEWKEKNSPYSTKVSVGDVCMLYTGGYFTTSGFQSSNIQVDYYDSTHYVVYVTKEYARDYMWRPIYGTFALILEKPKYEIIREETKNSSLNRAGISYDVLDYTCIGKCIGKQEIIRGGDVGYINFFVVESDDESAIKDYADKYNQILKKMITLEGKS